MSAKHPAAFINVISETGTKEEAIEWLQRTWDEYCDVKLLYEISIRTLRQELDRVGVALRNTSDALNAADKTCADLRQQNERLRGNT